MTDDSDSKGKKNPKEENDSQSKEIELQESNKPAPKKKKRTKDPNRHIVDLANKFTKLSQQISPFEKLKEVSLAYDARERMLRLPNSVSITEEIMQKSTYLAEMTSVDSFRFLCADSFGETARLACENAQGIRESLFRPDLYQSGNYEAIWKTYLDSVPFQDTIGDLSSLQTPFMNAFDISPLESIFDDIKARLSTSAVDFFRITSDLRRAYADLPYQEITVVSDERVMCAGAAYEISDVEKVLREKLEIAGFLGEGVIGEKHFAILLSEIRKGRDPSLKSIIYSFFIPLFVSIIMLYATPYLQNIQKGFNFKDKAAATKIIEREVPKIVPDKIILSDYRFVTASVLKVRRGNSQKSQLIGKLYFGSFVKIIQKKRSWTLIEWKDQNGDSEIRGWVFSRYLRKFR
jgi:Bacterial SH3 domain